MKGVTMRAQGERAEMGLYGDVGFEITAAGVAAALKQAGEKPITISINSYGGDALQGIAIHNMLARHPAAKTVVVEGVAASAGSLIAMAGDRIVMPENAFLMIHEAWGAAMGDAGTLREQAELLDQVSASYRRTYAAKSGKDEDEIAELMRAETWFTAEAAVEAGFAHEAAAPAEVKAFAAVPQGRFSRVPEALRALNPPASPAPLEEVRVTETKTQAGAEPVPPVAAVQPPAPALADAGYVLDVAERNSLPVAWANAQIKAAPTREAVLEAALAAVAAKGPAPIKPTIEVVQDEKPVFLARAAGALSARLVNRAPTAEEREFASMGFHALAREILVRAGERNVHRMTPDALITTILAQTHSTSDFANVLANSTNKSVRDMYMALPNNWSAWCDEIEVDDFKTITAASIGGYPEVVENYSEGGPITYGTIGEEAETYAVKERGRLLGLTRQAMVNDDMRAFQRVIQGAAQSGYTALRRAVFGILTTNAAMADSIALFNASHSNLGSAGALSATTYAELRALLGKQTQPSRSGMSPAAAPLPPPSSVVLITGPDEEGTALDLLGDRIVPTAVDNALPTAYRSTTSLVVDAFLDTGNDPYYLARTEPGMRAVEIAYLRGARTPSVTSAETINTTGMTFRVLFDFGAKAVTWRTIAANLG